MEVNIPVENEGKKSLTVRIDAQDEKDYREFVQYFKNQSELFSAMLKAFRQTNSLEQASLKKDFQEVLDYTHAIGNLFQRIVLKSFSLEEKVKADAQKKYGDLQMQVQALEEQLKTVKETHDEAIAAAVQLEREHREKVVQKLTDTLQAAHITINDLKEQVVIANKERQAAVALAQTREVAAKENDILRASIAEQKQEIDRLQKQTQTQLEQQARTLEKQFSLEKETSLLALRKELMLELEEAREKTYQQFLRFTNEGNVKK